MPSKKNTKKLLVHKESSIKEVKAGNLKIAIIGAGTSIKETPWHDSTWDFWGLNALWKLMQVSPRLWFEIHQRDTLTEEEILLLKKSEVLVYMERKHDDIPMSQEYPAELTYRGPMTCTFCYQLALAIEFYPREIGLFGVDLDHGTSREMTVERMGVWYWIGKAQGRGIQVTIPPTSHLLQHCGRYGMDYWQEGAGVRKYLRKLGEQINQGKFDDYDEPHARVVESARNLAKKL